ncbi:hypothetical protein KPH14_012806 [Odynerus spinipes]|uniref:Uncharacterized protein n=1 Tax=Odynerus spinipes TaxID=1348599 RepID=A0AAD9RFU7_9HYME|nr:hypothetical protein KPH14_012806 [Odynerus spinipes]
MINTVFKDTRKELLNEEDSEAPDHPNSLSPEVSVELEGMKHRALIDTGSTITAMSEASYNMNAQQLLKCPALPISSTFAVGATGGRSTRLKKQLWAVIDFGGISVETAVVIVPGLVCPLILGVDTLRRARGHINFQAETLSVHSDTGSLTVGMQVSSSEEDKILKIAIHPLTYIDDHRGRINYENLVIQHGTKEQIELVRNLIAKFPLV